MNAYYIYGVLLWRQVAARNGIVPSFIRLLLAQLTAKRRAQGVAV